jgi:hypothetical protein
MNIEELPWRELMQLHMSDKVDYIGITLAYARLIGEKDPRHKEFVERRIDAQMRSIFGIGHLGTGLHMNALLTKITPDWPGNLFDDIETEISGEHDRDVHNYLTLLCGEKAVFCTFLFAYFDRAAIIEYFESCNSDGRRFMRELLYLLCMRLDPTFVDHLSQFASDLYNGHKHLFLPPSIQPPKKLPRSGEDSESGALSQANGKYQLSEEERNKQLERFLSGEHRTFIPHQLIVENETNHKLRSLILWIPFILEHWDGIGMGAYVKMYTKLSYLQPEFNPRVPIGLYLYLCYFTTGHINIVHRRVRSHVRQIKHQLTTKPMLRK